MPTIEHAPPAVRGVQQIMGLSDWNALDPITKVTYASIGAWALGLLLGNDALKNAGLGGAVATFALRRM